MKRLTLVISFAIMVMLVAGIAGADAGDTYLLGDIAMLANQSVNDSGHFGKVFDLTACPMTVSYDVDLTGFDDSAPGCDAITELGVRTLYGGGDVNPSGSGVWAIGQCHGVAGTYGLDPLFDDDDKFILQRIGGQAEGAYNLPSPPSDADDSYRIWFDRDGASDAQPPLQVDGGTYNTGGIYDVTMSLNAVDAVSGQAYLQVNGLDQTFEEFVERDGTGAVLGYEPVGMTFTGDMTRLQVFYALLGASATHTVSYSNITVTGCQVGEQVLIDIAPDDPTNTLNLRGNGLVQVAVLTTDAFDAGTIDPATVTLGATDDGVGAPASLWSDKDVDGDGDVDLLLKFRRNHLRDYLTASSPYAFLYGLTTNGLFVTDADWVNIVKE